MTSLSATVIGGASWNMLVEVPRLPTDLTTLHATAYRETVGATGAGKALNLARLGVDTRFHLLLGEDEPGRRVRQTLEEAGVHLEVHPDAHGTERHLNLLDPRGDRLSVFLNHSDPDPDLPAEQLLALTEGADLVFVSLTGYAARVLPLLRKAGVRTWVDLHDWDGRPGDFHDAFVELGDYVFVSDVRLDDPRATAESLAPHKQLVVVTHGSRGATAFFPDREPLFVPAYDAGGVVDSNGAGDAFSVGVAFGRAQGWDWARSLQTGAVVAGRCVTSPYLADPALTPEWLTARL